MNAWQDHVVVRKRAGKVAGIIYPKHIGADRAGNIVFCEGAARQEKPVIVGIAGWRSHRLLCVSY